MSSKIIFHVAKNSDSELIQSFQTAAREAFKGTIIGNMGYSPEEGAGSIEKGLINAVAFGHLYVSNPNLVEKIKNGVALIEPDQNTYYTNEAKGYTDYPLN